MLSARQSIGIIALTVSLSPILPFLVQHGMFMDGTQYAIVSRNLAAGEGTFWFPSLSPSWYRAGNTAFMEQPPLFYFLESLVFRITGDTIFAERIFCAVCLLITVILVRANWRILNSAELQQKMFWWLPASLFLTTPTIFWCYRNNMVEM